MKFRWFRTLAAALPLLLMAACASSGPVLSEGVGTIRSGMTQAKTDSGKTFTQINATRRADAIQDILDNGTVPDEAAFEPVINADTAGRWNAAFDSLDEYLGALQQLVDPKRAAETQANLKAIGEGLQTDTIGVKLPAGSVSLFASFGGMIVQAAEENKARAVMLRTDGQFHSLMRKLGDLVYGEGEGTLSALVETQWRRKLRNIVLRDYGPVQSGSKDQRRPVVEAYAAALDQRDAQLAALANLRASLLALGEAHGAAARGSDGAVLYWIEQLNQRLKEARDAAGAGGR